MNKYITSFLVSAFVFISIVEAFYWPIINKPGTVLEWWQFKPLADIGFLIGAPVFFLHFALTRNASGIISVISGWAFMIFYTGIVFMLICFILRKIKNKKIPEPCH